MALEEVMMEITVLLAHSEPSIMSTAEQISGRRTEQGRYQFSGKLSICIVCMYRLWL